MSRRFSVPSNWFHRKADPLPPLFPEPHEGDHYWNTTSELLRVYHDGGWMDATLNVDDVNSDLADIHAELAATNAELDATAAQLPLKVNKAGDTMTGALQWPSTSGSVSYNLNVAGTVNYPKVADRVTADSSVSQTVHSITLPSGIVAGNVLIAVISLSDFASNLTPSAGWTQLSSGYAGVATQLNNYVLYKTAVGGDTLTVTLNAAAHISWMVYRITGASGLVYVSKNQSGSSDTPTSTQDCPALTVPTTNNHLWIAIRTGYSSGNSTGTPSGWSNWTQKVGVRGMDSVELLSNALTVDPAPFTGPSTKFVNYTLAVAPSNTFEPDTNSRIGSFSTTDPNVTVPFMVGYPSLAGDATNKAYVDALEPIGSIKIWPGASSPNANWLLCDGAVLSRTTYATLFGVFGTLYNTGGEAGTDFRLPNFKGRVPVGRDAAQAEFDVLGEASGFKTHTLTITEIPSHGHALTGGADQFVSNASSGGTAWSTQSGASFGFRGSTVAPNGGNGAHNNLQPYLVVNYIIRVL